MSQSSTIEGFGLAELMALDLAGLSDHEGMQLAAHLIDRGSDTDDDAALSRAEAVLDGLAGRGTLKPRALSRSHYFRANLWNSRRQRRGETTTWVWRSTEADNEILELRRAVAHPGFTDLHALERAQLLTNLGNALNHIGRFVEALEAWDRAVGVRAALGHGERQPRPWSWSLRRRALRSGPCRDADGGRARRGWPRYFAGCPPR